MHHLRLPRSTTAGSPSILQGSHEVTRWGQDCMEPDQGCAKPPALTSGMLGRIGLSKHEVFTKGGCHGITEAGSSSSKPPEL